MGDILTPFKHGTSHKSDDTDPLPIATTSVRGTVELATSGENAADVVVQGNDSRLSDSRTPSAHASTHLSNGSDAIAAATTTVRGTVELATDGETAANVVVQGNDARLAAVANKAPHDAQYVTLATDATLTNERVLTHGDGLSKTDGGAGSTLTVTYNPLDYLQKHIFITEEFIHDITSAANTYVTAVSGTAAAVSLSRDGRYVGVFNGATGTTTTGRAGLMMNDTPKFISFIFGQGQIIGAAGAKISIASAAAQEYIFRLGFIDNLAGTPVDGVWFEYNRLSSVNWRLIASSNSVQTVTTSSTAVDTAYINADVKFRIVVNAAGSSAEFFLNDVSIGTVGTTIPTTIGGTRDTSFGASMIKSAGTTSRDFFITYMLVDFKLTTTR